MTSVKKHALLNDITNSLNGNLPTVTVPFMGHSYKLGILKPEAEDWVSTELRGDSLASLITNAKRPTVAAALLAIDDISVDQLFEPDYGVISALDKERFEKDVNFRRAWRRNKVLEWLAEDAHSLLISALYEAQTKLTEDHKKTLREMENFSKGTTSQG